jgi:hypothetical protein
VSAGVAPCPLSVPSVDPSCADALLFPSVHSHVLSERQFASTLARCIVVGMSLHPSLHAAYTTPSAKLEAAFHRMGFASRKELKRFMHARALPISGKQPAPPLFGFGGAASDSDGDGSVEDVHPLTADDHQRKVWCDVM